MNLAPLPPYRGLLAGVCLLLTLGSVRAESPAGHPRPNPERFAKKIAEFAAENVESSPGHGGIIFTGSSSVFYWDLKKAFPDLPVVNHGFGGSVANDLVVNADTLVLRYTPKVVVVYTGSNDLHAKLTPQETLSDYTKFLSMVHESLPKAKVIVNSVKPAPIRLAEMPQVKELNNLLEAWCKQQPWITWIDASAYLLGSDGQPIVALYRKDHLHLNDDGYAKWNAIVSPILHKVWAEVSHE